MQETTFISNLSAEPHALLPDPGNSGRRGNSEQSTLSRFSSWIISNPKKVLAFTLGLAGTGVAAYFLANKLGSGSPVAYHPALINRTITSTGLASRPLHLRRPSVTTLGFISSAISELPLSVTTPPSTEPDWYKAITSKAQPSSESVRSSACDVTIGHPVLPTQPFHITTMTADGQSHPELPFTVTNSHQGPTASMGHSFIDRTMVETPVERPFAEYEKVGYLIFSDIDFNSPKDYYESTDIKKKILSKLPRDVHVVVYTSGDPEAARKKFQPLIRNAKRLLHILKVKDPARPRIKYRARDALPVPVYGKNGSLILVDAKYHHGFEPDQDFARFFNVTLLSHSFEFEGGNLLADRKGNCFTVDIDDVKTQGMDDDVFKKYYGCKRVTRFKQITKVGHIDEVIKIIDDRNIITDRSAFRPTLKKLGYNVTLVPRAKGKYANYLNAVIINGKAFVPAYGQKAKDRKAMTIYRSFGLRAYKLNSAKLTKKWMGSIHYLAMTYPKINGKNPKKPDV